jgi:hypothetical protein
MKRFTFPSILFSIVAFIFFSCTKDDPTPVIPLEAQTVSNLKADADMPRTGKFTLYSLKDNAIVANADSATNKWDIGFRATTIIVNGGAIRSGQGGAYIYTGLFDELTEIPADAVFKTDNTATELAITTGSGNGWYNYNPATNVISPIAGKILVIKTGDGKYAKAEILNYYKDAPATPVGTDAARHYKFKFIYQPNGTKKF